MKPIIVILAFFAFTPLLFAQSSLETVKQSRLANNEITLSVKDQSRIEFIIDDKAFAKSLDTVDYFQVDDKEFRIYVDFVNPLKFKVSSENKEVDDELFKATNDYLSTVVSFLQTMGVSAPVANARVMNKSEEIVIKDPQLAELYILLTLANKKFFDDKQALVKKMAELKFEETKQEISKLIDETFANLLKIDKIEQVETTKTMNKALLEKVDLAIKNLNERFEALKSVLDAVPIASFGDDENLRRVASFRLENLRVGINDFVKSITEVKEKYLALEKVFDPITKEKATKNRFMLLNLKNLRFAKRNEVSLTVQQVEFQSKDKTLKLGAKKTYLIHVRRYLPFVPVVATGILYSTLSFTRFGTGTNDAGQTIITQSKEDKSEIVTGAYLNFFRNRDRDINWFFQIGIGPSSDKPLLFGGLGISLINRVNLAAGAVWTWQQELKPDKALGQVVSGTSEVDSSIQYRFEGEPNFYIGININLNK